ILIAAGTEGVKVNTPIALLLGEGEDKGALEKSNAAPAPARAGNGAGAASGASPSVGAGLKPAPAPQQPPSPPPKAHLPPQPAEPEYTGATQTQTVREALRDAMAEEMRRDSTVFLM